MRYWSSLQTLLRLWYIGMRNAETLGRLDGFLVGIDFTEKEVYADLYYSYRVRCCNLTIRVSGSYV